MFDKYTARRRRNILNIEDGRFLRIVPILGYILAQVVVLGACLWTYLEFGVWKEEEYNQFLLQLIISVIIFVPPALVIGLLDGVARVTGRVYLRLLASTSLLLLALFIGLVARSLISSESLDADEPITPALSQYQGVIAGVELALIGELVLAIVLSKIFSNTGAR